MEVSVTTALINREKANSRDVWGFTQEYNELCGVTTLTAAGTEYTISHRKSDRELRLRAIPAQPTVSMLPPKQQCTYLRGEWEKGIAFNLASWPVGDKGHKRERWHVKSVKQSSWWIIWLEAMHRDTQSGREREGPESHRCIPSVSSTQLTRPLKKTTPPYSRIRTEREHMTPSLLLLLRSSSIGKVKREDLLYMAKLQLDLSINRTPL